MNSIWKPIAQDPIDPVSNDRKCVCENIHLRYLSIICLILSSVGVLLTSIVIHRQSDIIRIHDAVEAVSSRDPDVKVTVDDAMRDVREIQSELDSVSNGKKRE